ncbi:FliI/YscN family ATPase [Mariniblastus fucicola]|uniref:Putative ATP synthase YscN n=1 Tax=Mariniblastus fucicola TaxID=980251 RepID=A0A5B9PCX2_9BACT|nr:FliI/YscN family ATPase [Mariniblastus fucicola]QEG23369.1 putative ATP synthase YscN [Mariniblastus fucicola]
MINVSPGEMYQEIGRLRSAQGMIRASLKASVGELVTIKTQDGQSIDSEVIGFDGDEIQIMTFEPDNNVQRDDQVIGLGRRMKIPVGFSMLGRIVNAVGAPIDGLGELRVSDHVDVKFETPNPLDRTNIELPFVTGVRAIDGLNTMGRGQRVGLFAGSGVGKSTLLGDIARNAESDVNVVALIGERGREVRPFVEQALGKEGLKKSVLIVSTSDQSPLARVRASETAVVIASWFREQGKDVLLMLDSLTRLSNAQRELGLLLGEPPTARGYTPSVFQKMAVLLEQLGTSKKGSITGILTVLVDGDDMNEPIADAARSILDGHIVLDRKLAHKGHFPAIDILASASRLFTEVASDEHQQAAIAARQIVASFRDVEDLIQIGAYQKGAIPATDAAVAALPTVNQFLQQAVGQPSGFDETTQRLGDIAKAYLMASKQMGAA